MKHIGVRVRLSSILTFQCFPQGCTQNGHLVKSTKNVKISKYDWQHLFLRPDSESLMNFRS